ncbi:MAG: DUF2309 family protein, partial [Planctomycetaceae bacterium]|nr:DUF2309 family protein [Planctomycetaceae bacterium]
MSSSESTTSVCDVPVAGSTPCLQSIEQMVKEAAAFLPPQGPITGFTFLNPLGALEHLPFDEALRQVPGIFGCEPYLSESAYRRMLHQGRIQDKELQQVLLEDHNSSADERIAGLVSRGDFRFSVLHNSLLTDQSADLNWLLMETDVLTRFRVEVSEENRTQLVGEARQCAAGLKQPVEDPELATAMRRARSARAEAAVWEEICLRLMWQYCRDGVAQVALRSAPMPRPVRSADLLKKLTGSDADELVHELLISFCASYLDQGFAEWNLPDRSVGFLEAFSSLFLSPEPLRRPWLTDLRAELLRLRQACTSPAEWIADSLQHLGISAEERAEFLRASLLALKGYAGMLWQTESRPDRVRFCSPQGTLMEFLAVRLLLDRLALRYLAKKAI